MSRKQTGIEKMRAMVAVFNECRESFNDAWSIAELERLYDLAIASGWLFTPDEWTEAQITDAMRYGIAPAWNRDEQPVAYTATLADIAAIARANKDANQ